MVFLTLDLFFGGMWFLSPYSRSESAHPRLMESDDVVCFSRLVVLASSFLCMSELDRAGASLNAISLSLSLSSSHSSSSSSSSFYPSTSPRLSSKIPCALRQGDGVY